MNCETLTEYLDRYGPLVAARARAAFEPLHVPATDPAVALALKRPLLPAQAHAVTASAKTLSQQKSVFLAMECGTGKTCCGATTVHAQADGRPYRAIALVPPHLIATWQAELKAIFGVAVEVLVLNRWDELPLWKAIWRRGRARKPVWLIMAETTAKHGPYWRPAAIKRRGLLYCPVCGQPVKKPETDEYLTFKDLEKSKKVCAAWVPSRQADGPAKVCGSPLWTYTAKERVWAPANYVHKHMQGMFDYLIIDEAHQEKSDDSARANAAGALAASVKKVIAMTGTLIGGKASHVRSLLFRLSPQTLRAEDLTWKDAMEFAHRYGRVDTIITEKESASESNRRSSGKTKSTRKSEQPGVMPTLYGRHLIGNTVFLSLADVADDLPPYEEIVAPVKMSPLMAPVYDEIEKKLKDAVKQLMKKGSGKLLGPMLHCLLAWPDYPYDWKEIGYVDRSKDVGPAGRWVHVVQPPTLERGKLWPKERELLNILAVEKAQGRQSWVFAVYTETHPVLDRLEEIIRKAGFRVKVLRADKVPTRDRSRWIAEHAPACDVIISHPQPVGTGLTLFDPGGAYNFSSLVFYETGYDVFTLRQASRRSWRIGQREDCRVYFVYYEATMQSRAMHLMARKLDASLALEGQFSADGLAAMCADGGTLAMELAKSLVENIDFAETERVWEKLKSTHASSAGSVVPHGQLALGLEA
jgi:hypothetical protein